MSLTPQFLDELRSRISLADIAGRRLSWDKRKSNPGKGDYWACCPFHQEKSSSFHVEDRKGFYYCFGCHEKGDAITFVQKTDGLSFIEAVRRLAGDAGMALPDADPAAAARDQKRAGLVEAMEAAVKFARAQLRSGGGAAAAREYIERRGLTAETINRFELGYAPDSSDAMLRHLREAGFSDAVIDEAGLCGRRDDGSMYDRFRGRILFPIRDGRGRAIAFGGRSMDPNARAKYLNSPETPLFHKGATLYNVAPAREAAAKAPLIVAEGYMDVIALAQAGFGAAVAPLGTALTEDQLRLCWRMADEPILALDGDAAGLRAAMRAIDIALPLLAPGKTLRFALLPGGKDPDDLIRGGGAGAMREVLEAAEPLVTMLWRRETEGRTFDTPERRAALDVSLREALGKINDQSVRAHYTDAIKERRRAMFAPSARIVRPNFGGRGRNPGWREKPGSEPASASLLARGAPIQGTRIVESAIVLTFLRRPELLFSFESDLESVKFSAPDLDLIRGAILFTASGALDSGDHLTQEILQINVATQCGRDAIDALLAFPPARMPGFAAPDCAEDEARAGLTEAFSRLRTAHGVIEEWREAETAFRAGDDEACRRIAAAAADYRAAFAAPASSDKTFVDQDTAILHGRPDERD